MTTMSVAQEGMSLSVKGFLGDLGTGFVGATSIYGGMTVTFLRGVDSRSFRKPIYMDGGQYQLRAPANEAEWQSYHEIRRAVLWEARGQGLVYDPNRPDERLPNRFARILFFEDVAVGVLRIDIEPPKAIFRRVAVRLEQQRKGHGARDVNACRRVRT